MSSEVAAKATDSSSITETSPQPLLAPSAAVYPTFQPKKAPSPPARTHTRTKGGQKTIVWKTIVIVWKAIVILYLF